MARRLTRRRLVQVGTVSLVALAGCTEPEVDGEEGEEGGNGEEGEDEEGDEGDEGEEEERVDQPENHQTATPRPS